MITKEGEELKSQKYKEQESEKFYTLLYQTTNPVEDEVNIFRRSRHKKNIRLSVNNNRKAKKSRRI